MPHWIRKPARRHVPVLCQSFSYVHEFRIGFLFDYQSAQVEMLRRKHQQAS